MLKFPVKKETLGTGELAKGEREIWKAIFEATGDSSILK